MIHLTSRRHRAGLLACTAGAGCLVLTLACDSGRSGSEVASSASVPAQAETRSAEAQGQALPRPGAASLQLHGTRITLLANRVPAQQLLDRLRDSMRFDLEVAKNVILPRAVTLQVADARIETALDEILAGLPYAVFYAIDPDDDSRVVSRIRVGGEEGFDYAVAAAYESESEPEAIDRSEIRRARQAARARVPKPTPEEIRDAQDENHAAYYDELFSPDPTARADAVASIYLDDRTFPVLSDLLANDPDPRVRAAAASTLSDDLKHPTAGDALLVALGDSNSEVVIEALDALEDVGSPRHIAEIQPLLLHPDPEVQKAAIDAIEWLEE